MTILLLAAALASAAPAPQLSFRSGPAQARLIELYSSEGCSSCPPADEWLASLKNSPRLWKDFVPAAFHVTYWDSLGWKDRFGNPDFNARQRAHAASWGSGTVYTPGLVLDGREWRGWGGAPPEAGKTAGVLDAKLSGVKLRVRFSSAKNGGPFDVQAARLGFGLASKIDAGENAGRVLRHEFVVRALARSAMKSKDGAWTAELSLPPAVGPKPEREGVAVWVTDADGRPAQAAGAFLP